MTDEPLTPGMDDSDFPRTIGWLTKADYDALVEQRDFLKDQLESCKTDRKILEEKLERCLKALVETMQVLEQK